MHKPAQLGKVYYLNPYRRYVTFSWMTARRNSIKMTGRFLPSYEIVPIESSSMYYNML
jgi:hypothetical protein